MYVFHSLLLLAKADNIYNELLYYCMTTTENITLPDPVCYLYCISTEDIQRRKKLADEAFARRFDEVMKKHNSAAYVQ